MVVIITVRMSTYTFKYEYALHCFRDYELFSKPFKKLTFTIVALIGLELFIIDHFWLKILMFIKYSRDTIKEEKTTIIVTAQMYLISIPTKINHSSYHRQQTIWYIIMMMIGIITALLVHFNYESYNNYINTARVLSAKSFAAPIKGGLQLLLTSQDSATTSRLLPRCHWMLPDLEL